VKHRIPEKRPSQRAQKAKGSRAEETNKPRERSGERKTRGEIPTRPLWQRMVLPVLFIAGLVGVCSLLLVTPVRQLIAQQQRIADVRRETERVDRENAELERRIAEMSEDATIERLAREDLGLVKPGEELYVVVPRDRDVPDKQLPTLEGLAVPASSSPSPPERDKPRSGGADGNG
jgi:cell division protein FtsL